MQTFGHKTYSAAVKGGIDELDVGMAGARLRRQGQRHYIPQVAGVHVRPHQVDAAAALPCLELDHRRLGNLVYFVHYLLVDGRCNLPSIAPEHLVSVIFLGIVGGRYHNAGNRLLEAYCVAQFGRRTDVVEDENVYAVGRHHIRGDTCELLAVVAAVVGDAEAQVIPLAMAQHIVREALGGHSNRVFVHTVGTHAHNAAQASGAELQILVESILERGRIGIAQFYDFTFGFGIEIAGEPGIGP